MLAPEVAKTVCALSPLSESALKVMVQESHRLKLPLPAADRDQWCMRLDSTITGHNALVAEWAKVSNGIRKDWRAAQNVNGRQVEGFELFALRDALKQRVDQSQATLLSIAAMLVLDERMAAAKSATPTTCAAGIETADKLVAERQAAEAAGT